MEIESPACPQLLANMPPKMVQMKENNYHSVVKWRDARTFVPKITLQKSVTFRHRVPNSYKLFFSPRSVGSHRRTPASIRSPARSPDERSPVACMPRKHRCRAFSAAAICSCKGNTLARARIPGSCKILSSGCPWSWCADRTHIACVHVKEKGLQSRLGLRAGIVLQELLLAACI
jgi:hypothetical protein